MKTLPSLVEIATQKCMRHVNQLQDVGTTPYHLMKPILRKMNAKQLASLEEICPQLKPFSDELWSSLIAKDFPNRPAKLKTLARTDMPNKTLYMQFADDQEAFRKDSTERLKKLNEKLKLQKAKNSVVAVEQILRDPTVRVSRTPGISFTGSKNSILNKARRETQSRSLMFPNYHRKSDTIHRRPVIRTSTSLTPIGRSSPKSTAVTSQSQKPKTTSSSPTKASPPAHLPNSPSPPMRPPTIPSSALQRIGIFQRRRLPPAKRPKPSPSYDHEYEKSDIKSIKSSIFN